MSFVLGFCIIASPTVLVGQLEEAYYQHHLLLVEAVYLLLQDTISNGDIAQSERLMKHYYYLFGSLYGKLQQCKCDTYWTPTARL